VSAMKADKISSMIRLVDGDAAALFLRRFSDGSIEFISSEIRSPDDWAELVDTVFYLDPIAAAALAALLTKGPGK